MAVLLLEAGDAAAAAGDGAPGRVQVVGAERLGHAVPESGRRLGVPEHQRRPRRPSALGAPSGRAAARRRARSRGSAGMCLPSTVDTSRCARRGLRRRASSTSSPSGSRRPVQSRRRTVGRPSGRHRCRLAPSRSTNETSSRATPNTSGPQHRAPRPRGVRLALVHLVAVARRGRPAARRGREDVAARPAYSSCVDDRQRVHGGDVAGVDDGLAGQAVGPVEGHLADQPVQVGARSARPAARAPRAATNGDSRSCGLNIRSVAEKYSHTGPVTT